MNLDRAFLFYHFQRILHRDGMSVEATEHAETATKMEITVMEVGIRPLSFLINMASNIG
jgi:hypothetical protein